MKRTACYITGAILLVGAAAMSISCGVREDLGWIDAISGSHKNQTVWTFFTPAEPVVTESNLAARYRSLGLSWEPEWRNVQGTSRNIFGRTVCRSHGSAPEIYPLATMPSLREAFLASASDSDIGEFFRVMTTGSETEKKAAVDAACESALRAMERG